MSFFQTQSGRVRAWWRGALIVVATIAGGLFAAYVAYGIVSLTPIVDLARQYAVSLADFGELLALAIGTSASVRIIDGVRDGIWSRVGLGPGALRPKPLVIGLAAGTLAILVPCGILIAAGPVRI